MGGTGKKCDETASRAFRIHNGTFGKIWGLKPYVVYWIHMIVIRPILTYGSTFWWPKLPTRLARKNSESY
jgi:hypothetical protein